MLGRVYVQLSARRVMLNPHLNHFSFFTRGQIKFLQVS